MPYNNQQFISLSLQFKVFTFLFLVALGLMFARQVLLPLEPLCQPWSSLLLIL
jgi:hypothetical protein